MKQTGNWHEVVDAIACLAIRGAPAIGLAGAAAFALWAWNTSSFTEAHEVAHTIAQTRPTAINLQWALERMLGVFDAVPIYDSKTLRFDLFNMVVQMENEDEKSNRAIGFWGADLLKPHSVVLTHCNAGSLATSYYGTALGVIYTAASQGKIERVFVDETRPVGQGSRLTVWELAQVGIPTTLICDSMAAVLMARGVVDAVIVGADRIAANGDTANKIGTYGLAILAQVHSVPFYVAAPSSSFDSSLSHGSQIPLEERSAHEVLAEPLSGVDVWNPAFDVTPAHLITAWISEEGVHESV